MSSRPPSPFLVCVQSMVGYEVYGVDNFPGGTVSNLKYVRFVSAGKQFGAIKPALKREPPLVLHAGLTSLQVVGVVVTEPMAGHFFECTGVGAYKGAFGTCSVGHVDLEVRDSVFVGQSLLIDPGAGVTHTLTRNVFFGGIECRIGCPDAKMVIIGNDDPKTAGVLHITNNTAYNGYGGFTLKAPCANYEAASGGAWSGNVAIGNAVGFDVAAGCRELFLEAYRNAVGLTAATTFVTNFLAVENGVGVTAGKWTTWPDACTNKPPDKNTVGRYGLPLVAGGVVVGRAPDDEGSVRSSDCGDWASKRGGYHIGGIMVSRPLATALSSAPRATLLCCPFSQAGYRTFGEYGYTGFSAQGLYVEQQGTGHDALFTQVRFHSLLWHVELCF